MGGPGSGAVFRPIEDRFWEKVWRGDGCWLWTGSKSPLGYGQLHVGPGKSPRVLAHRFAYELLVGPVPEGMDLDHLCREPQCVNPDHLEPVSHKVNVLRGASPSARNANKTHCKRGHPFEGENLIITRQGWRQCRACIKMRFRGVAKIEHESEGK